MAGRRVSFSWFAWMAVGLAVSACQTQFTGSPTFPGGARGCFDQCRSENMEMASFVYVGEYSTACACKPPGAATHASTEAGVVAAGAGVNMQMQREQQQRGRAH